MTKDEYDDIVKKPITESKRKFELIGGPLDGERGSRYSVIREINSCVG